MLMINAWKSDVPYLPAYKVTHNFGSHILGKKRKKKHLFTDLHSPSLYISVILKLLIYQHSNIAVIFRIFHALFPNFGSSVRHVIWL